MSVPDHQLEPDEDCYCEEHGAYQSYYGAVCPECLADLVDQAADERHAAMMEE